MSNSSVGTSRSRPTFRYLVAGVATVTVAALLAGCSSSSSTPDSSSNSSGLSGSVVVADYGGPTHEIRASSFFEPFSSSTGVKVTSADYTDAIANAQLDGKSGEYDLIQSSTDSLLKYKDNLEKLPAGVTRNDNVPADIQDYAVGSFTIGIAQGWLTQTFSNGGPQNWADFFDTEKFPGKRAWPGSAGSYDASFEIALLADGVAPDALYPIDFDRAIKKLDKLKSDMVFYDSYPEVQQLLSSGTASIAVTVTGQFAALQKAGLDVTVQWNQAFLSPNFFVIPKSAKNKANAYALAEAMTKPTEEASFTKATKYGPGMKATLKELDADTIASLPNAPDHTSAMPFNEQFRSDNLDKYLSEYTSWLAK